MISRFRPVLNRLTARLAWALEVVGLTPNAVTFLALAVTGAGAWLIASHHLVWGAAVAGLGGVLDAFDGALARRMGRESAFGGYLDSLLDRYADGLLFFAVGWHYDTLFMWAATSAAFLGAVATSYAKARAYEDVDVPTHGWTDLLERAERLILLLFGVGIQGLFHTWNVGIEYLPWLIVAMAALGHATVVQRALRAKQFLEAAGRG